MTFQLYIVQLPATNASNLVCNVRSIIAGGEDPNAPDTAPPWTVYWNYDPAVDKLWPGLYHVSIWDQGNYLAGNSALVCMESFKIKIDADADAKLDSDGNPIIKWTPQIMSVNTFIPTNALSIDNNNNTITFNLNPDNGTYTVGILTSSGSPYGVPVAGTTGFTTESLPADTYTILIQIDAGVPLAGGKCQITVTLT